MKTDRITSWNTKYMRHTPMTVEQYLKEQIAKSRTKTPVTFWSTDPTNHDVSYNMYTAYIHMCMNHDTNTRPNGSVKQIKSTPLPATTTRVMEVITAWIHSRTMKA